MHSFHLIAFVFAMCLATSLENTANAERRLWNRNRNFSTCPWTGTPPIEKMGANIVFIANTKFNFVKRKHRFAFENLLSVCGAGHILPKFYEWRQAQNFVNAKTVEASAYAVSSGVQAAMTDSAARRQAIAIDAAQKAVEFAAEMTPLVADARAKKRRFEVALRSTSAPASVAGNMAMRPHQSVSEKRQPQSTASSRPDPTQKVPGAIALFANGQTGNGSAMAHTEVGIFLGSDSMSISDTSIESESGFMFGLRGSVSTDSSWAPELQFIRHSATHTNYGFTGTYSQMLMGVGARFYLVERGIMPFVSAHLNYHLGAEASLSDELSEIVSMEFPDSSGLGTDLGGGVQIAVGDSLYADALIYYCSQLTGETKLITLGIGIGFGAKF